MHDSKQGIHIQPSALPNVEKSQGMAVSFPKVQGPVVNGMQEVDWNASPQKKWIVTVC